VRQLVTIFGQRKRERDTNSAQRVAGAKVHCLGGLEQARQPFGPFGQCTVYGLQFRLAGLQFTARASYYQAHSQAQSHSNSHSHSHSQDSTQTHSQHSNSHRKRPATLRPNCKPKLQAEAAEPLACPARCQAICSLASLFSGGPLAAEWQPTGRPLSIGGRGGRNWSSRRRQWWAG